MRILGIETSCDETSVAIIQGEEGDTKGLPAARLPAGQGRQIKVLANVVVSSLPLHAKTGGIIPEIAARQQIKYIIPTIKQALTQACSTPGVAARNLNDSIDTIDAIAVTVGPGLIGSLLVGVETAKTLSYVWKKPLIPVNHLMGHIYANFISTLNSQLSTLNFPALALIVSGGHTDLVLMKKHGSIKWLGGTRDDAAGEAFDKIGRLLGLPYPGGPAIEKAAQHGIPGRFTFPRPLIDSDDFDFSFSGLKTAVFREVRKIKRFDKQAVNDISLEVQNAVIDVLVAKTIRAAQKYKTKSILLSGGVAANQALRDCFELNAKRYTLVAKLFAPPKSLCTDNAAMIASAAFFNYAPKHWKQITADPELYFE